MKKTYILGGLTVVIVLLIVFITTNIYSVKSLFQNSNDIAALSLKVNTATDASVAGKTTVISSGTKPVPFQCGDKIDNDGDGLIDYPADTGCSSLLDNDELNKTILVPPCSDKCIPPTLKYKCSDLIDNDNDGLIDQNDPGCHTDLNVNNTASYVPTDTDESDKCTVVKCPVANTATRKIYFNGGYTNVYPYQAADFWSYNGTTWTQLPDVPRGKREDFASAVFNGKIYLFGGISFDAANNFAEVFHNDVWSYNGTTWTHLSDAPWVPRGDFSSVVINNKIYIFGGRRDSGPDLSDVWSFDGTTWVQLANAPWPYNMQYTANVLTDTNGVKKIYVAGGNNMPVVSNNVWSFDGTTWVQLANAPWSAKYSQGSSVLNNKLYVYGGLDINNNPSNDVWSFDGSTWTQLANAPWSPRAEFASVTYNNGSGDKIYVLGTWQGDVWKFDGTTWTQLPNSPLGPRTDDVFSAVTASF